MKKANYAQILGIGLLIFICIVMLTLMLGMLKSLNTLHDYYELRIKELEDPKIEIYFNCQDKYNYAFFNCPVNQQLVNLSGLYCDGHQLCANSYKILG